MDVSTVDLYALWEEYSTMSLKCIAYRCKIRFRKKFVEYTENMYSYVCVIVSYATIFFFQMAIVNGNEVLCVTNLFLYYFLLI